MEFVIEKKKLLDCLNHFQSVVEKRNTIPILSNIKITADDEKSLTFTATDLALDMASRFVGQNLPKAFYNDWLCVADDKSHHFLMLSDRLAQLGAAYGDLPAHDGLWQAAHATTHDLLARLAIAPLALGARGLDVTPAMIE